MWWMIIHEIHESIEHGASKNKSMGMRDAHAVLARALVHTFQSSELALVVFGVMKKFVDQVCPHFPVLGDVNPSVFLISICQSKYNRNPVLGDVNPSV